MEKYKLALICSTLALWDYFNIPAVLDFYNAKEKFIINVINSEIVLTEEQEKEVSIWADNVIKEYKDRIWEDVAKYSNEVMELLDSLNIVYEDNDSVLVNSDE